MTALKDIAQRRARRRSHERGRRRLRYGIGLGVDMTPDDLAFDPGAAVDVAEAEPEPLRVALAERVGR